MTELKSRGSWICKGDQTWGSKVRFSNLGDQNRKFMKL